MENISVKFLMVSQKKGLSEQIVAAYGDTYKFEVVEQVSSLREAVQELLNEDYSLCFVADEFTAEELESFFKDVNQISQTKSFVVTSLVDKIGVDTQVDVRLSQGFHSVVTPQGSAHDKDSVRESINLILRSEEIKKRIIDVSDGLSVAMQAIDRVAESLKRGSRHMLKLDMLAKDFIKQQTNFDGEVLDKYYDTLSEKTEGAKPNVVEQLDIPEELVMRGLPGMKSNTYDGASHRVWGKLKNRFGLKTGEERQHEIVEAPVKSEKKLSAEERLKAKLASLGLNDEH